MAKSPSSYELHIMNVLKREGIKFVREKSFQDWGKLYRYDFYLPNYNGSEILIEVDGHAHFEEIPFFHKKIYDFRGQQARDRRKNDYALARGIDLYRIPYWDVEKINTFWDVFTNPRYLVRTSDHNDKIKAPKER